MRQGLAVTGEPGSAAVRIHWHGSFLQGWGLENFLPVKQVSQKRCCVVLLMCGMGREEVAAQHSASRAFDFSFQACSLRVMHGPANPPCFGATYITLSHPSHTTFQVTTYVSPNIWEWYSPEQPSKL